MKKLISLALALVMICAMATTAFATDTTTTVQKDSAEYTIVTSEDTTGTATDEYTWTIDVQGAYDEKVEQPESADKVAANYYVVVTWDVESTLTYTVNGTYVWNVYNKSDDGSEELADGNNANSAGYDVVYDTEKADWVGSATINVSVENWSNRELTATVSYANVGDFVATYTIGDEAKDTVTMNLASAADGVTIADKERTSDNSEGSTTVSITDMEGKLAKTDDSVTVGTVTVKLSGFDVATTQDPAESTN